jgi:hypothetical protein
VQYKQKWLNNVNQNGRQYTLKTIPWLTAYRKTT